MQPAPILIQLESDYFSPRAIAIIGQRRYVEDRDPIPAALIRSAPRSVTESTGIVALENFREAWRNRFSKFLVLGHGIVASIQTLESQDSGADVFMFGSGRLGLIAMVSGEFKIQYPDDGCYQTIRGGQSAMMISTPGKQLGFHMPQGQHLSWITLSCNPTQLAEEFRIPGGVERLHTMFSRWHVDVLDGSAQRLVSELANLSGNHPMTLMHAEAKALELLGRLIAPVLSPTNLMACPPRPTMPLRELRQLQEARTLLGTRFEDPPTIAELARRVGTNQSKLMSGFKALYGETMADFARRQRMELARTLLQEEGLGVAEVAYRVGYRHHSSFSFAFSSFFGMSPSEMLADEAGRTQT